tara:strand:- start:237 stop:386 length:150 start_codon:yes stop_codon:yes gene_type:complete
MLNNFRMLTGDPKMIFAGENTLLSSKNPIFNSSNAPMSPILLAKTKRDE